MKITQKGLLEAADMIGNEALNCANAAAEWSKEGLTDSTRFALARSKRLEAVAELLRRVAAENFSN